MRRLIALAFLLTLFSGSAWAACPATLADCPTMNAANTSSTVYAQQYGAIADRIDATGDLNVTASSTAATTTTTTFTAADCQTGAGCTGTRGNKIILIKGAGATGYALLTTIAGYVGPHAITLGNAAVTTVANANFSYSSNMAPAINAAITAAAAKYPTGARVELPSGGTIINPALTQVTLASNITLDATAKGASSIICASLLDSTSYLNNACILGNSLTNVAVKNLTIKGVADLTPTRPTTDFGAPILIVGSTNIEISGVTASYTRTYTLSVNSSTTVTIDNNYVSYTFSNAVGCGGCYGDIRITNNHIDHAADAAIAVSSADTQAAPSGVRNLVVSGNSVTEAVGVQISGGRSINITGNSFIRMIGQAIFVQPFTSFGAGDTATTAVNIVGNTVQDVINSQPGQPLIPSYDAYMVIGGGQRQAGSGPSVPGYPVSGTGVVTDLYGANTTGNFFANGTNTSTVPSPGSIGWNISNNVLVRTLPAVTSYAQWGYGTAFWGAHVGVLGTYTGPVAEADLQLNCIMVREQALRLSSIHDNICATTGDYGINLVYTNPKIGDYDGLRISNNTFYDYNIAGIFFNVVANSSSQISITNNEFNGDPRFRHANRGTGGTWAVNAGLLGISDGFMSGIYVDGNRYRNVVNPVYWGPGPSTVFMGENETLFGLPAADGFSTSNIGVGAVNGQNGVRGIFRMVCEDDNPQSATFGQMTSLTGLGFNSNPTTGCWLRGTFVKNMTPTVDAQGKTLIGWERLTTSSTSNVLDADWKQVYSTPPTLQTLLGVTPVTTTTYTVLASDMGKIVYFNNAAAIAVTLPTSGAAGFESYKCFNVTNIVGAGTATLTPASGFINGVASKAYAPGASGTVCASAPNWLAY